MSPERVLVRYDHEIAVVRFGVAEICRALAGQGVGAVEQFQHHQAAPGNVAGIVVRREGYDRQRFETVYSGGEVGPVTDESFELCIDGDRITVQAGEDRGLLYGCLELAERIAAEGWPLPDTTVRQEAALGIRGIKYNLPYESYAKGEPFRQNESSNWDMRFWRGFLDHLARSRFNLLSLWSEHPWHLLVTSPRYRDANPASDLEMDRRRRFFQELLEHARDRGIDVVLFTWNVALSADAADALGVPHIEEPLMSFATEAVRLRQHSPAVRDYIEEMVFQTLTTYPLLQGIGTSASETMLGSAAERQQWVSDTYAAAYERSGRHAWFIQRTNMQSAGREIKELVQGRFPPERFFISWKYAQAHAYSHPAPQFEELYRAWDGVDLETTNVLYTVRNDDVNTHQWADADYVAEFVQNMRKPYVKGFYWGSDGYVWGRDFQHADYGHKSWEWDYERHGLQLQLWGRLSYDPTQADGLAERLLAPAHGDAAPIVAVGLAHASRIIPAVNRLVWRHFDWQWHPESCLTWDGGFRTVLDFLDAEPMPGVGVVGMREFLALERSGDELPAGETPATIVELLRSSASRARAAADRLDTLRPSGLTACVALDLHGMAALGDYYAAKIEAALDLLRCSVDDPSPRAAAVDSLEAAVGHWEDVARAWGQHYRSYDMPRTHRPFGYLLYLDDVRHDVELARAYQPKAG